MDKRYIYVGIFGCVLFLTMAVITVLLLLTFFWNNNLTNGSKLVIDTDGGADDAMAIFIALIHEKYFNGPQVVALTTIFGNVDESQAFINCQKILHLANRRDIPIYRGNKAPFIEGIDTDYYYGSDGLGLCDTDYEPIQPQPEHAVQALVELSNKYEGNLTIAAVGPLTNVALAIKMDPEFLSRLSTLYIGAGNIQNPSYPGPEFNAAMDPEAYYIILKDANPNKVTIVPYTQVHEYMNLTKEWRQSTLGEISTNTIHSLNCFERISMENSTDWTQLDPAVISLALNSSIVEEVRYAKNSIVLCGDKRGVNTNVFKPKSEANVKVIYSGSREKYQDFLLNTFSAELSDTSLEDLRFTSVHCG